MTRRPPKSPLFPYTTLSRSRAVAELELTLGGLGGSVADADHVLEAVASVERDDALAFGVDAPPARPARHLRQLVVGQRAEPALRPLGQPLQHHGPRRHVDAEAHRLGGEDHLAEAALEEALDQPLEARQEARGGEAEAQTQRPKEHLVPHPVARRRALP